MFFSIGFSCIDEQPKVASTMDIVIAVR